MTPRILLLAILCCPLLARALEGRVVDATSGQPIAGAVVTAESGVTVSGSDGHYQLPARSQHIHARAIGYARGTVAIAGADVHAPPLRLASLRPKALYLSVYGIGDAGLREAAVRLIGTTELNALVIDIKGDSGLVPYPSKVAEATLCGARGVTTVRDMPATIARLKGEGIYLIARIVAFKDDLLAESHPDWSVKTADGRPFRDREHFAWIDPFRQEAWNYMFDLAEEAASMGFDEIQFDYVRFPDSRDLRFAMPNTEENRVAAIGGFLQAARKRLAPHNVFLSADIFGYVAWNMNDTYIGQDLATLADAVDYISPMLYPSGFQFGIPRVPDPVQQPFAIVQRTLQRAIARTGISPLRFRPWLQAFRDYAFDRRLFDADEVRAQINAADAVGSDGWMLWNPRNTYTADGLRSR